MVIVQVHARVKTDLIEAFKAATAINAAESLKEPGVARFDVAQQIDDPSRFTLIEVYRVASTSRLGKAGWRMRARIAAVFCQGSTVAVG